MKALTKINKFYLSLGVVLFIMSLIIIFTLRTIFSSLKISQEVNEELFTTSTPRINRAKLNEAMTLLEDKEIVMLDL